MRLAQRPQPFDHPDWIFKIKHDGFRSSAFLENCACRLISRRNHQYSFRELAASLAHEVRVVNAVLDGEIVCVDALGRSQFNDLLFRRGTPKSGAILYADHLESEGVHLYDAACKLDLEGIVPKWRHGRYIADQKRTSWIKIKNPAYSRRMCPENLLDLHHALKTATSAPTMF